MTKRRRLRWSTQFPDGIMSTAIRNLLILSVVLLLCGTSLGGDESPSVAISEISCFPGKGGERWIEIVNWGSNATAIAGWCLSDGIGNTFSMPEALPPVPPGAAVVVVVSSMPGAVKSDFSFAGDKLATLIWARPATTPAYPDVAKGVCVLYKDKMMGEESVVDAVCWSFREHQRDFRYPESIKGLWPPQYTVRTWTPETHKGFAGGNRAVSRDGTLARVALSKGRASDWFVCPPEYTSRGKQNRWIPPTLTALKGFPGAERLLAFGWQVYGGGGAPAWRLQVAATDRFEEPVVDGTFQTTGAVYLPKMPYAGTHLFWRIRGEGSGVEGHWSETVKLEVESIEEIEKMMSPYYRPPEGK